MQKIKGEYIDQFLSLYGGVLVHDTQLFTNNKSSQLKVENSAQSTSRFFPLAFARVGENQLI
jgi:hypothetical protein